jgi:serine/threonine protein kinase
MSDRDVIIAGRYRLVERIGLGGMGSVWMARDERLQRTVAVKLLHLPPDAGEAEAEVAKNRAMREARITARLHHPHAVPVFDVVEHDGQPCLIMQYLPSKTLQEMLTESGRLPADEVALIGAEVGSALAAAHAAGIVHRDVKPANILISPDGSAKITDFGISHALGDPSLTSTGMVTGTPAFLSPEVARGEPSSSASDVFSLGSTLYTAVEGSPPFGTDANPMALLHRVASEPVTPPTRAGALTTLLLAMLSNQPSDRPSMAEAAESLARLELGAPVGGEPTATMPTAPTQALPTHSTGSTPSTAAMPAVIPVGASGPSDSAEPLASPPTMSAPPRPTPVGNQAGEPRSHRGLAIVGALVGLGLVAFLAWQTLVGETDRPTAAAPPATSSVTSDASPTTTAPKRPPTRTEATTTAPSPARTSTPPTSSAPRPTPSRSTRPAAPSTSARLSQAIRDYYALMPNDTEEGYALLTARYRSVSAPSFEAYENFWDDIARVTVKDTVATPPQGVEATLTYTFNDGRVVQERTAYTLVEREGVLMIDGSEVLSSREL